jgi:hypothetical protein
VDITSAIGEHGDPFAVRGSHRVQTPDGAAVAVRD